MLFSNFFNISSIVSTAGANVGCAKAMWNLTAASLGEMVDVRSMVARQTNER